MTEASGRLHRWRRAIVGSTLAPTTRHVALTLSLHMNAAGESCFPSQSTLASETGMSRETVNRHVRSLVDDGYLEVERRGRPGSSSRWSNEYRAAFPVEPQTVTDDHTEPVGDPVDDDQGVTEDHSLDVTEDHSHQFSMCSRITGGVTEDHRGCDGGSHEVFIEVLNEENTTTTCRSTQEGSSDNHVGGGVDVSEAARVVATALAVIGTSDPPTAVELDRVTTALARGWTPDDLTRPADSPDLDRAARPRAWLGGAWRRMATTDPTDADVVPIGAARPVALPRVHPPDCPGRCSDEGWTDGPDGLVRCDGQPVEVPA